MSATIKISDRPAAGGWGYDGVAKTFHWLVVAMLVVQYSVALVLGWFLPKSAEDSLATWHFSMGSSILVVMLARLAWRLTHTPPPPPKDLSTGLRMLSRWTHLAFYAVLIVLPVLGWAAASADGARVSLAGLIPLPLLVPKGDPFGKAMQTMHPTIAISLLAVIALHVAGALYHALVKRDGVIQRMLPGGASRPS
jgi:cytochrome b561